MIYKLVCASDDSFSKLYSKDKDEIIIAIDGGYQVLVDNNIGVDYFFGDYDSLKNNSVKCNNKFNYSPIKDDSDFDLTIKYLIDILKINKDDLIYVYNCTGGRLDHYYAILNTLKKYCDYQIYLFDCNNKIYLLKGKCNIIKTKYKYISFFSIDNETILSIEGCKYLLDNYNLQIYDNLCLSNEIISEAIISCNKNVLVFETN